MKLRNTPSPSKRPQVVDLSNSVEKPSSHTASLLSVLCGGLRAKPKRPLPPDSDEEIFIPHNSHREQKDIISDVENKSEFFPLNKKENVRNAQVCQVSKPKLPRFSNKSRKADVVCAKAKKFSRTYRPRDVLRDIKSTSLLIDFDSQSVDRSTLSTEDLEKEYKKRVLKMGEEKASDRKKLAQLPSRRGRIVVFDTETTGFSRDDCVIEIGAAELLNGELTGVQFHSYINAARASNPGALKVHGLTQSFLSKHRTVGRVLRSFTD